MAHTTPISVHVTVDPNLEMLGRIVRRVVQLERANAMKDALLDEMAQINADQTAEIDALKTQRDSLNAEIQQAVVDLADVDPDPAHPTPISE
jgi:hypothetical protein